MYITKEKLGNFIELMVNTGKKHNCIVEVETDSTNPDVTRIDITGGHYYVRHRYYVHWAETTSLTNAAVDIWADFFKKVHEGGLHNIDNYIRKDIDMTKFMQHTVLNSISCKPFTPTPPKIKDVIFNPPATIVFWADNTKTVVKCQEGDIYDPEKGLAMAFMKKTLGNKGNYCNEVKKWTEKYAETFDPVGDISVPSIYPHFVFDFKRDFKQLMSQVDESVKTFEDILNDRIAEVKAKAKEKNNEV